MPILSKLKRKSRILILIAALSSNLAACQSSMQSVRKQQVSSIMKSDEANELKNIRKELEILRGLLENIIENTRFKGKVERGELALQSEKLSYALQYFMEAEAVVKKSVYDIQNDIIDRLNFFTKSLENIIKKTKLSWNEKSKLLKSKEGIVIVREKDEINRSAQIALSKIKEALKEAEEAKKTFSKILEEIREKISEIERRLRFLDRKEERKRETR